MSTKKGHQSRRVDSEVNLDRTDSSARQGMHAVALKEGNLDIKPPSGPPSWGLGLGLHDYTPSFKHDWFKHILLTIRQQLNKQLY